MTTSDNSLYLAYDFDNKQTVQGFKEITALLKKHGGSGETIFESKDDFEAKCHHPWLWELHYLNYR
ncbi:hypothetical protein EON83_27155 [bacterium]|nr:MAG: hypothetical protein EON83_27155 [bacterium]